MTCPECQIAYDHHHWDACPHCGCEHEDSAVTELSGVIRTSTILIAAGNGEPEFYGSIEEVPEPLRRILVTCTNGHNSGTVYISSALHRSESHPGAMLTRFSGAFPSQKEGRFKSPISLASLWFSLVMALFLGAIVWLLGSRPW